ncbi:flagellar biosynthesis protein FlhB [Roseovarius sp. SYSU LYC5161]|uniref:EscU/YscU/HrcU family type III secretion system export apparatus switch protein n=1 Tax=Roseovarius halophilus (ex Wu et al. 2025) TaxID=3376060 RepID=UPI0028728B89|nr:flagellar type III secretion system protein FlhB [Roseovarius sp.]
MAEQDDETDKPHDPTQQKLDELRQKGDIARSADLVTAGGYAGFLLAALAFGQQSVAHLGTSLMTLIDQAPGFAPLFFGGGATAPVGGLLGAVAMALGAWILLPAGMALLAAFAQRGMVFSPDKLRPRLSRIDPIRNAGNKYGWSGLFEFAKSFAKLLLFSTLLGAFLTFRLSDMAGVLHGDPRIVGSVMGAMLTEFMLVVVLISLGIGAVDYLWQRHDHLRRNRMSQKEMKDEHKKHEGDPHIKQERRQRAARMTSDQSVADVADADVVLVNPTHFAVALKWSRSPGSAPVCVAKGQDHLAQAIRSVADDNGVPVRSDPPTARALYAVTEVGHEIAPEYYRPVAAAIRFAEAMRRKAGARGA